MNRFLSVISLIFLLSYHFGCLAQVSSNVCNVDPSRFMDKILEENNHLLIDVRPVDDFNKNHIPGAVNAPSFEVLNSILDTIDPEQPVLIYCEYGERSYSAAIKALERFCIKIFNLKGGLKAWRNKGFEINRNTPD